MRRHSRSANKHTGRLLSAISAMHQPGMAREENFLQSRCIRRIKWHDAALRPPKNRVSKGKRPKGDDGARDEFEAAVAQMATQCTSELMHGLVCPARVVHK